MERVLVETGEQALPLVLRAEEHTAQINTARDDSEMYTAAEEFELLFQDIPFAVPKEDEIWSTAQAPIDILSCTTTMEVGIDIEVCPALLRTVPRKKLQLPTALVGRAEVQRRSVLPYHGAIISRMPRIILTTRKRCSGIHRLRL